MGIVSKLFGGNDDTSQPKTEQWQTDTIPAKSEWQGTFYDRMSGCPDCDGVFLCDLHMAELQASTKKPETELPPQPRLWLW